MLPDKPLSCGVVIYKDSESENVCPERAIVYWTITNPDNVNHITGMVLLCQRHSEMFERGTELVVLGDDGSHLLISLGEKYDATTQSSTDGAAADGSATGPERDETGDDGWPVP